MFLNSDHNSVDAAKIVPRLWVGSHPPVQGHRCRHCDGRPVDLAAAGFTCLVLCASGYQPDASLFPGVKVVHVPFDDDQSGLSKPQLETALRAVEETVTAHEQGHRVLVTCIAGRNRSGLVTAWALSVLKGVSPASAGEVVRSRRGHGALTNLSFRKLLAEVGLERDGGKSRKPCELCKAESITHRYYEDAICWVADCKSCGSPMVVYKAHTKDPQPRHRSHMVRMLRGVCGAGSVIVASMKTIPDHWHAHARQAPRLEDQC